MPVAFAQSISRSATLCDVAAVRAQQRRDRIDDEAARAVPWASSLMRTRWVSALPVMVRAEMMRRSTAAVTAPS